MKPKKQTDAEFIEKCQSIHLAFGSHKPKPDPCAFCGSSQHPSPKFLGAFAVALASQPAANHQHEESFSA